MKKQVSLFLVSFFIVVLFMSLGSAGLFDWFNKITGKATTQTTTLNITITNAAPTIPFVWTSNTTFSNGTFILDFNPVENGFANVTVNFYVDDADGTGNLENLGGRVNISRAGEPIRYNESCSKVGNINGTRANFTCAVKLWYWDGSGAWNLSVSINDSSNSRVYNNSGNFTYVQLTAFVLAPGALTWTSISPGAYNQTSNNDPLVLNNTGNYAVTTANIQVNATDLDGETDTGKSIYSSNISVGVFNGSSPALECNIGVPDNSTQMARGLYTNINMSQLPRGNHTYNNGTNGQEYLFFCIRYAGSELSSQAYSTLNEGAWTVKILGVLLMLGAGFSGLRVLTRTRRKALLSAVLLLGTSIMFVSAVSALGVLSPYWNERPMQLAPGETGSAAFSIQNSVGDQEVTIQAAIINGSEVASITDTPPRYSVPTGGSAAVNVLIRISENAQPGMNYTVGVSFTTVTIPQPGKFTFGAAFEKSFPVQIITKAPALVAEIPQQQAPQVAVAPEAQARSPVTNIILIVIILLVVLAILYLLLRNRKKTETRR